MSNYKKYSDEIKNIIIKTGDINALPELKIPRTTALYWIKSSKKKIEFTKKSHKTSDEIKVEGLEKLLEKEKAKNIIHELETKPFGRWASTTQEARKKQSERMKEIWRLRKL